MYLTRFEKRGREAELYTLMGLGLDLFALNNEAHSQHTHTYLCY